MAYNINHISDTCNEDDHLQCTDNCACPCHSIDDSGKELRELYY